MMVFLKRPARFILQSLLLISLAATGAACSRNDRLIDRVTVVPSNNLESIRVALVFNPRKVQSTLGGGFQIGRHGYLFLNPATQNLPFEVGFELNTEIFQDPEYVKLEPTTVFPNGLPMNLPQSRALVQIRADQPIGKRFDAYAYVDILQGEWMGTAIILDFIDDRYFPPGLAFSQVFARDSAGEPSVIGAVFGPELNPSGGIRRSGGISVLVNVKSVMKNASPGRPLTYFADEKFKVTGPGSKRYGKDRFELMRLEEKVIQGLNSF